MSTRYAAVRTGVALLALLPALAACGLGGPAYRAGATDAATVIDMGVFSYDPAEVTVRAGDTVEWRNTSPMRHTVTADAAKADHPADEIGKASCRERVCQYV